MPSNALTTSDHSSDDDNSSVHSNDDDRSVSSNASTIPPNNNNFKQTIYHGQTANQIAAAHQRANSSTSSMLETALNNSKDSTKSVEDIAKDHINRNPTSFTSNNPPGPIDEVKFIELAKEKDQEHKNIIANLNDQAAHVQQRISALQASIDHVNNDIKDLKEQKNSPSANHTAIDSKINALEAVLDNKTPDSLTARQEKLEAQKKSLEELASKLGTHKNPAASETIRLKSQATSSYMRTNFLLQSEALRDNTNTDGLRTSLSKDLKNKADQLRAQTSDPNEREKIKDPSEPNTKTREEEFDTNLSYYAGYEPIDAFNIENVLNQYKADAPERETLTKLLEQINKINTKIDEINTVRRAAITPDARKAYADSLEKLENDLYNHTEQLQKTAKDSEVRLASISQNSEDMRNLWQQISNELIVKVNNNRRKSEWLGIRERNEIDRIPMTLRRENSIFSGTTFKSKAGRFLDDLNSPPRTTLHASTACSIDYEDGDDRITDDNGNELIPTLDDIEQTLNRLKAEKKLPESAKMKVHPLRGRWEVVTKKGDEGRKIFMNALNQDLKAKAKQQAASVGYNDKDGATAENGKPKDEDGKHVTIAAVNGKDPGSNQVNPATGSTVAIVRQEDNETAETASNFSI